MTEAKRKTLFTRFKAVGPALFHFTEFSRSGLGWTSNRSLCRAITQGFSTGLQHRASAQGFSTGLQHRASAQGFNTQAKKCKYRLYLIDLNHRSPLLFLIKYHPITNGRWYDTFGPPLTIISEIQPHLKPELNDVLSLDINFLWIAHYLS